MTQIYYTIFDLHNADWWPLKYVATKTLIARGLLEYVGHKGNKVLIPKRAVDDFLELYQKVKKDWTPLSELLKTMGKKKYKQMTDEGVIQKVEIAGKVYCLMEEDNK